MLRLNKKAQTTAEYAILFGLVVGAVIAMQVYVKRGMMGRLKDAVDDKGGEALFTTKQYEPYYLRTGSSTQQNSESTSNLLAGGAVDSTETSDVTVNSNKTLGWNGAPE